MNRGLAPSGGPTIPDMGRPLLLLAIAATVAAGCTSSGRNATPTTTSAHAAAARAAAAAQAAAMAAARAAAAKAVSSTTALTCSNTNGPDYILWTQFGSAQPSAIQVGAYNLSNCTPTPQEIQSTSPKGTDDCTILAPASANPGYDINASPAPKPKGAVVTVGGAC